MNNTASVQIENNTASFYKWYQIWRKITLQFVRTTNYVLLLHKYVYRFIQVDTSQSITEGSTHRGKQYIIVHNAVPSITEQKRT